MRLSRISFWLVTLAVVLPRWLGAGELTVADGATLEVDVRATGHSFTAHVEHFEVSAAGDLAKSAIERADVRFRWAEVKTGKPERDEAMLKWAGAEKNPEGHFVLESFQAGATAGTFQVTGKLELAGKTQPVSFPVQLETRDGAMALRGEASIDYQQWGLPKIRKFGVFTVNPVVKVRFVMPLKAKA